MLTGLVAITVWGFIHIASQFHWFGLEEEHTHQALLLVLGVGENVINQALAGELILALAVIALLAKMWASLFTISSGGSAGLLIPSLFFGTMIATIFAQLPAAFGLDLPFVPFHFIVPAMTASLVSIVNVPLAATLFAVEVFSGSYMVPALITLVVAAIVTHQTSIYRTQREIYHERQILPGYSVRRIPVPLNWQGQTLIALDIRRRYQLNVIGWVNLHSTSGAAQIELSAEANRPLAEGDILVVLGRDEDLARFAQWVQEENTPRPEPKESNPAG
jgi:CIC family chloride channel protein